MKIFFDKANEINMTLKWLMEENPIIFRRENIVIPLIAAIREFIKQKIINISLWINNIKILIGIIFWIVININAVVHLIPSIAEIIQKWNGNIPSFIKIAVINIVKEIFSSIVECIENEIIIILEEILWIRKYIIVDFSLKIFWLMEIRGIIENKLISILIHIVKKELEDKQIKILLISDNKNKFFCKKKEFFISWLMTTSW